MSEPIDTQMSGDRESTGEVWVQPPLTPARMERQWEAVRDRLAPPSTTMRVMPWVTAGVGLVAGVSIAFAIATRPSELASVAARDVGTDASVQVIGAGAIVESGPEPVAVTLADGSLLELDADTRLVSEETGSRDVRFALDEGRTTFDVARDPSRTFSIVAGDVRVVVVGTRFSVGRGDGRVEVRVERGQVDVHAGGTVRHLGAGEEWSGDESSEVASAADEDGRDGRARRRRVTGDRGAGGEERAGASELFEQAGAARRGGDDAEAARLYAELLDRFPRDSHAGLASFELGRLRMDALGDARGAIAPLRRAASLRGTSFREDAMARLARAYDAAGDDAACARARDAYLAEFAEGVHATALSRSCR